MCFKSRLCSCVRAFISFLIVCLHYLYPQRLRVSQGQRQSYNLLYALGARTGLRYYRHMFQTVNKVF